MEIKIEGKIDNKTVLEVVETVNKEYTKGCDVNLVLDSLGGYIESTISIVDIFQTLRNSGSHFSVSNSGDVMSSATLLWLFCDDRIWDESKGLFLVHNPYLTNVSGDSETMLEAGVELAEIESDLADVYAMYSKTTKEQILDIMKKEQPLTVEELVELNFITNK